MSSTFGGLWASLLDVGRNPATGGYLRFAYNDAEMQAREWFIAAANSRGLEVETDRNGNLWGWLRCNIATQEKAIVIGSHLDSVPEGGAFDGPLGVVSALAAIDLLRERNITLTRDLAVVVFADEEGARFGIACAGSRLMTGALAPEKALGLLGRDGQTMAEAMKHVGFNSAHLGADLQLLDQIGVFIELHIEQGKALAYQDAAVGVATTIWPHGRYRFTISGRADHAGTTAMTDRQDPMTTFAQLALETNRFATQQDIRATFGRIEVTPNGTNAIPSEVNAWLDLRTPNQEQLDLALSAISSFASASSKQFGTETKLVPESVTGVTIFDAVLREEIRRSIANTNSLDSVPAIATGAGHDAGILAAAGIPTAMIFVRNPTGVSHSPQEFANEEDALAGVHALTDALIGLM